MKFSDACALLKKGMQCKFNESDFEKLRHGYFIYVAIMRGDITEKFDALRFSHIEAHGMLTWRHNVDFAIGPIPLIIPACR
ncbi:hypothetical protein [Burkholderia oklahomensis]|uniref:hypothetical protein n=1 Tax=Burkholderia oklahomensis TaxID=342113 RepID=UPI000A840F3C|nr:hypothetical protein [Burkholderia oklahomensis]MBI0362851.1 hypothetical protein [Burkholderia oklahomensis]